MTDNISSTDSVFLSPSTHRHKICYRREAGTLGLPQGRWTGVNKTIIDHSKQPPTWHKQTISWKDMALGNRNGIEAFSLNQMSARLRSPLLCPLPQCDSESAFININKLNCFGLSNCMLV